MWKKITGVTLNYSHGDNNGNPLAFFPHRSGMVAIFLRKWTKNGGHRGECRELPPTTAPSVGDGR